MADTRDDAEAALNNFVDACGEKHPKAAEKLPEDRDELMALCDFTTAHGQAASATAILRRIIPHRAATALQQEACHKPDDFRNLAGNFIL